MRVVRMRRGWRVTVTDNEMELLRELVARGMAAVDAEALAALPYKVRKVVRDERWSLPDGPLNPDEDRRAA